LPAASPEANKCTKSSTRMPIVSTPYLGTESSVVSGADQPGLSPGCAGSN
jgi:hypothetical protein